MHENSCSCIWQPSLAQSHFGYVLADKGAILRTLGYSLVYMLHRQHISACSRARLLIYIHTVHVFYPTLLYLTLLYLTLHISLYFISLYISHFTYLTVHTHYTYLTLSIASCDNTAFQEWSMQLLVWKKGFACPCAYLACMSSF